MPSRAILRSRRTVVIFIWPHNALHLFDSGAEKYHLTRFEIPLRSTCERSRIVRPDRSSRYRHRGERRNRSRHRDRIGRSGRVLDELKALGCRSLAMNVDVTDRDGLEPALQRVERELGGVDILVNNAGHANLSGGVLLENAADWDRVIETQLNAVFLLSKLGAAAMVQRRRGKIINIGSMYSFFGSGLVPSYSAAKGAVIQLTKSMAIELAPHNIQVNAIAPGWIETDMTAPVRAIPMNDEIVARTPAGRMGAAGRDCRNRGVFGLACVRLRDRRDHLRGWRLLDQVMGSVDCWAIRTSQSRIPLLPLCRAGAPTHRCARALNCLRSPPGADRSSAPPYVGGECCHYQKHRGDDSRGVLGARQVPDGGGNHDDHHAGGRRRNEPRGNAGDARQREAHGGENLGHAKKHPEPSRKLGVHLCRYLRWRHQKQQPMR